MKKKLFLALLTSLLLLLAATTALAESPSDYNCLVCGEPCTFWFPFRSGDGIPMCHVPGCNSCQAAVWSAEIPCTPDESTATCIIPAQCSVCGHIDRLGATNPNAHDDMSEWKYNSTTQHYRYCLDCFADASIEYEDHYGGTATCIDLAICEGCYATYGELDPNNHDWGDWVWLNGSTHVRECRDCPASEEGNHTGGTATCMTHAICEVCNDVYGERDTTRHGEYSGWGYYNGTQHYRWCLDCSDPVSYEYEDHYGGTATCSVPAFCEGCDQPYGPYGDHSGMTGWVPYSVEQHYRRCLECGSAESYEYEDHYGGDGSCRPTCEACGERYYDADGEHRNMSDWSPYSATQHFRYCKDCDQYEYANHHGGDGSCTPVCADCSQLYSDENGEHRNVTDWIFINNDRHFRYCPDCGSSSSYEYAEHTGGKANCTEKAVCEGCGEGYGELAPDDHDWGEWKSNGNGTHTRVCANDADHTETEDCTGGKASCTEDGVCEVCEAAYIPALQHSWGEWKPNGNGTHTRICKNDATHTETEDCTGGTATCTDKAICEVCGSEHGAALGHIPGAEADCTNDQFCTREGCGELLTEKLGHDYTVVVTKSTCTEPGYTTYTCSRCEESYQADQTAARGHWYDLWYPNRDGTHSAKCKRYGCRHEGTTECTLYEITVKDGEDEVILTVCPVCGDHETATFSVMSGATIKNVFINHPLPYGEQIVRELDAPFDGVLYAFTAAYESAARVIPFNGKVSVSLPLDTEKYAGFRLVRVDVTQATETAERTEVWTDVAFTFENGRLTFETDVAGLFLLVPME